MISCGIPTNKQSSNTSTRVLYDSTYKYMDVMTQEYNENGLVTTLNSLHPFERGIYLDTIISTTKYFYDSNSNLQTKLRISNYAKKNLGDSILTSYYYNDNQNVIKEYVVEVPKDTVKITYTTYSNSDDFIIKKIVKLEKDHFSSDINQLPFDTTITFFKEKHQDSLKVEMSYYKNNMSPSSLKQQMTYHYNLEKKLVRMLALNQNKDSVSWKNIYYSDGHIKKEDFYYFKEDHLCSSIYNENGFLTYILNCNTVKKETDTTFVSCDKNGNIIELKSYSN